MRIQQEVCQQFRGQVPRQLNDVAEIEMHPAILQDVMQQMRKEERALQVQRCTTETTM